MWNEEDELPYQSGGDRKSSVQLGVGRSLWSGSIAPLIPERVFDGIPGFLAWLSLILITVGAIYAPRWAFGVAMVIAVYMAVRMILGGIGTTIGLKRIREWEATDWREAYAREQHPGSLAWDEVLHVICIPNYKEEVSILRQTLQRLSESPIARTQVAVVLAMEAGEPEAGVKAIALKEAFVDCFKDILITLHPKGLYGELQGKSANENWAVRSAKRHFVDEGSYSLDQIVVTICDADSLLHPLYLECLTAQFATSTLRHATVWQAPIRYHSNVWSIHPALGLVQAYSSAWELAYLAAGWWHPLPISTYSLSLRLADEVGYWDTDVIAEDVHMFIKCFFRRRAKLHLGRVFLPFSANSVTGNTFWEACKNRYQQMVRHAWGAKEVGYTLAQILERPDAAPLRAQQMLFRVTHDHIMAGAGWITLTFGQALPVLLHPTLAAELTSSPQFYALQAAYLAVGILGVVFWWIDMRLRPPKPTRWTLKEVLLTLISLPMLGPLTVILVALPVMQAQTRLLLGMPIQYRVARKV
jgi:cellulose synthase/poly-beta-1,6-N-acetylglucosamine synthase-like glycosyltransferase